MYTDTAADAATVALVVQLVTWAVGLVVLYFVIRGAIISALRRTGLAAPDPADAANAEFAAKLRAQRDAERRPE